VSHILELLGRSVGRDLSDLLDRYFWSPTSQSIEQLQAACRQQPTRPEGHLQLGLACLRAVQLDEAIRHLSEACRLQPDCLAARLALASTYDEKGCGEKALEHLKIANQTHTGQTAVLFALGFCLEKLQRPEHAAAYYRDAIEQDPACLSARQRLAAIDVLTGDLEEAIEQYQALRDAEPEKIGHRSALAHLYYRAGRHRDAVDEFETALAMEPENWALVDDEVEALVADGQLREAIERLRELVGEQGPFPDLHVRLGDLYSRVGDDAEAMRNYLLALDMQPHYLEATVKLGTHHLLCGRWEDAAECFHRGAELTDRVLLCYVGIGVAKSALGEIADAMNSFQLAAAIEPNGTLLLAEMAKLQLKAAVAEEFTESFCSGAQAAVGLEIAGEDLLNRQLRRHAQEVRLHPGHADLRYRYGVLLLARGRPQQAMAQFRQAVRINPAFVKAWIKLGVVQQELGLEDRAVGTFHQALNVDPGLVELHYRLGLLYTDREKFEQAVRGMEDAAAPDDPEQVRANLALSLQNMGLMDRLAATWRSLWKIHRAKAG